MVTPPDDADQVNVSSVEQHISVVYKYSAKPATVKRKQNTTRRSLPSDDSISRRSPLAAQNRHAKAKNPGNDRPCSVTVLLCAKKLTRELAHRWTWVHFTSPNPTQLMMLSQGLNPTHPPLHNNPCNDGYIFQLNVANSKIQNRPRSYVGYNLTYAAYKELQNSPISQSRSQ